MSKTFHTISTLLEIYPCTFGLLGGTELKLLFKYETRQLAVLTLFKNNGNDASLPRAANAASKCIQINSNAATAAVAQEQGTSFFFMHSLSSCVSLSSRNFLSVSTHLWNIKEIC